MHLAHPLRTRAIAAARVKTDAVDAKTLAHLLRDDLALRDPARRWLDSLLSLIDDLNREVTATSREIDLQAKVDERVTLLCQIRGVGRYTAMLIIAEIGDIRRFPTARHLCAWVGLDPDGPQLRRQSKAGTNHQTGPAPAALGAGRGRAESSHRRRPVARAIRADR
jgi:transposase